jgi:DNA replication protein DnaC
MSQLDRQTDRPEESNALALLSQRRDKWAEHAKKLPTFAVIEPTRVAVAKPQRVQLTESDRNRMDDLLAAEAAAKNVEQWRANLKRYAPIEDWELAWDAKSMPDHNPELEHPDFYAGTQAVLNWIANGCPRHLVLIGAIGCGKSIAAAVAVRHWVEPKRFQPVSWMTADELVSAVFHSYSDESKRLCRYVVVDDMGDERKADFEEALRKLLEQQDHKIIITTNLAMKHKDPAKTFRGRYTRGRLLSMMRAKCKAIVIPGGSRRDESEAF